MDKSVSIDDILGDFSPTSVEAESGARKAITVWVSADEHARYERIQESSRRKFSKKLRELFLAALGVAEKRAS